MDVGIGVPNTIPGATGGQLLEWARRAEARGFSSLASIGRVAYPGYEELTVFAAAGAVTERIRLFTNILLAPTRSGAELAKQAASVDQLSNGRLTLGLGVGTRADDYEAAGRDHFDRGRRFDQQLRDLKAAWAGEPIGGSPKPVGPAPVQQGGIPILVGGTSDAAIRRVAEYAEGWTIGGAPPEMAEPVLVKVRQAWADAGRAGEPRIVALSYFSLGDVEERSRAYLLDYYSQIGDAAQWIADGALRSDEAIHERLGRFDEMGVDEVILDPTVTDLDQVDLLADIVFR